MTRISFVVMLTGLTVFSHFASSGLLRLEAGPMTAHAQPPRGSDQSVDSVEHVQLPDRVEVRDVSPDEDISRRLQAILTTTGWFTDIEVRVEEGVVFLDGRSDSSEHREWAGTLASKTSDVVAVVNRIRQESEPFWDFTPAFGEAREIWGTFIRKLPRFGLGLALLVLVGIISRFSSAVVRKMTPARLQPLLREVSGRVIAALVFLLGCYLVLQIAGLSGLAATVLGGTGLLGLVAGIAFRDILENYLASILISLHNPFHMGDMVEIAGFSGIVLRVTTRGTVLMDLDGNHVQIPNATVYKNIISNYTANPNRRETFEVGIGYEVDPGFAQGVAMRVLEKHPAVLADPEPQVLLDRLAAATVNLVCHFWYDGSVYNGFKVKSSLLRLIKRAFEENGIPMPDEAREVIFPEGVQVRVLDPAAGAETKATPPAVSVGGDSASDEDLASEENQLRQQAKKARVPEEGASLLDA